MQISPTKIPQAIGPAFLKVAKLMMADPHKTMIELNEVMADLTAEAELPSRIRIQTGRMDTRELHPDKSNGNP